MASLLLDATMEAAEPEHAALGNNPQDAEPETDAPEDEDDDEDFRFDAPSYYDLKNPALERRYVNNADGYFSSPAPADRKLNKIFSKSFDEEVEVAMEVDSTSTNDNKTLLDTTMAAPEEEEEEEEEEQQQQEDVQDVMNRSNLLDDREESFEEVFRHYASSSQSSATSSYLLHELDTSTHSSHGAGGAHFSPHSSQTSSSSAALREATQDSAKPAKSRFSAADGGASKLMQPTQSYLRRLQAEKRMREQTLMEDVPVEEKPHRVTRPRSPKLHSKPRSVNKNDPSRMSSTSRELLKIQEERLHLQLEKLKIREFHEKTKVQRPPSNVHQRSTKQLTIPQTPHFQVDNRVRRFHSGSESSVGSDGSAQDKARPPIAAEKLLTRDFSLPAPPHARETRHALTTPHSPQLHTATRAAHRPPPAPLSREQEKPAASYSRPKFGGLTQPMTPQLETGRRAATHRRPIEVVDHDAEELAKKFHARPVNKSILEPKSYPRYSPAKSDSKARITQPVAPKLSTSARSVTRQSASERAASVAAEMERHRKEREQRLKARQAGQMTRPKSGPASVRRPVVPETPPLKSIQLHREYQENFRRKIETEEKEREKQCQFRAQPMRVASTPARPLTQTESPMLATKNRAAERAAYEAAEKERREREEAFREQRELQEQQLKEEEIKRMRQTDMIFHARSVPEDKPFQLKRDTRPLTEPISPIAHS
ncbi:targeting protein for isoform 1 [Phytophthora cinnamomi]|uniref:targeting protein for isoform 1 n=1 Tax=Phytophthora cinnamomi TaxID=4785 RepID=UPI00355A7842|nr:targeting protein for isoform 1 [Phytophthora cinnamomi]